MFIATARRHQDSAMASTALHIGNMLDAINEGVVPGAFNADRTAFEFPVLVYNGSRGATRHWTIKVRLLRRGAYLPFTDEMLGQPAPDLGDCSAEIYVESWQSGGAIRAVNPTYVNHGKNLGKKNATNPATQALRDALGLYNTQKKRADLVEVAAEPALATKKSTAPASAVKPAVKPLAPGTKPLAPGTKPLAPGTKPLAPGTKPLAPGTKPLAPGTKPLAPGTKPLAPVSVAKPPAPVVRASDSEFDEMPPPMLVKKSGDTADATLMQRDFVDGVTAQRKYNGIRYVVFARPAANNLVRYSRTGTEYPGQQHVVDELQPMFACRPRIAPGQYGTPNAPGTSKDKQILEAYGALSGGQPTPYLDGELFKYGKSLAWISGQARRGDDDGVLEFHVFDVFFPHAKAAGHDMPSKARQEYLAAFFAAADADGQSHPHVVPVENVPVRSMVELDAVAKRFVHVEKYEGTVARKDKGGYRYGYSNYHSSNIVKIKPLLDAEFPVVGFTEGRRGKDVGALIWVCEVSPPVDPKDKTFTVVPKNMTYSDRKSLFKCLGQQVEGPEGQTMTRFERDLRGLPLTIEFPELSPKTGKPLQAKAVAFRTYESGPAADCARRVFAECLPKTSAGQYVVTKTGAPASTATGAATGATASTAASTTGVAATGGRGTTSAPRTKERTTTHVAAARTQNYDLSDLIDELLAEDGGPNDNQVDGLSGQQSDG
jgi:hypothetical protein